MGLRDFKLDSTPIHLVKEDQGESSLNGQKCT